MADLSFEFENFPRGKLPTHLSRRQFFQGVILELSAFVCQDDLGHPVYRLSDLGDAPNQEIAFIVPVQVPKSEIFQKDDFVWGTPPETRKPIRLFPVDTPALFVLEQFTGEKSIIDISRDLVAKESWEKQRALGYVRGVFLWLVLAKLFAPKGK